MDIPSLTEEGMDQLVIHLNNMFENKGFTTIYIQKSDASFEIDSNCANLTARVNTGCDSSMFIEIRYSDNNGENAAAFEIHTTTEISVTDKTIEIITKIGLRNVAMIFP